MFQQHSQQDGWVQWGPRHNWQQNKGVLNQLWGPNQRPFCHNFQLSQQKDVQRTGRILPPGKETLQVSSYKTFFLLSKCPYDWISWGVSVLIASPGFPRHSLVRGSLWMHLFKIFPHDLTFEKFANVGRDIQNSREKSQHFFIFKEQVSQVRNFILFMPANLRCSFIICFQCIEHCCLVDVRRKTD